MASASTPAQTRVSATSTCGWYVFTAVKIRSGPGTGYGALGILYPGQRFTVNSTKGGWYNVTDKATGVRGWSSADYIGKECLG